MGEEKLEQAKRLLTEYGEEQTCGWCQRTAGKLATAIDEFKAATPAAMDFKRDYTGKGELAKLDDTVVDLKETRLKNEGFHDRLSEVLDRTERVVERHEATARPPRLEHERQRLEGVPGFVTPDQIQAKRDEQYRRYKQVSQGRKRGPIRDRLAFGVWKIVEFDGPFERRRIGNDRT